MKTTVARLGETWDMLSFRMYGDEYNMDELLRVNYLFRNTAVFRGGEVIAVPEMTAESGKSDLPPWKR